MIIDCMMTDRSTFRSAVTCWKDVRRFADCPEGLCLQLDAGYTPSLTDLAFVIKVCGEAILTNGLAARIAHKARGKIIIGSLVLASAEFNSFTDLVLLEQKIYRLACEEFGRAWLSALAKNSRPLMIERDRRLSILRAHLRDFGSVSEGRKAALSSISDYLAREGTGTWI